MKIEDFMQKLFVVSPIKFINETSIHFESFSISKKILQDNIDLLARELHMEVEKMAEDSVRELKHDEIYLPENLSKTILNDL